MFLRHFTNAFIFGSLTLFWSVTALIFLALGLEAQYLTRYWAKQISRFCGVSLRVHGEFNLDAPAYVVMSNHRSYFDPLALMAVFPRPLFPIAKKELGKIPFLGWVLRAGLAVMIDRTNRTEAIAALGDAQQAVEKGRTVLIFPEGTRGSTDSLKPFKKGGFHLSQAAQVPILPVFLKGTDRIIAPKSWRVRPGVVDVVIGELVDPSAYETTPEGRSQLMADIRARFEQMNATSVEQA